MNLREKLIKEYRLTLSQLEDSPENVHKLSEIIEEYRRVYEPDMDFEEAAIELDFINDEWTLKKFGEGDLI